MNRDIAERVARNGRQRGRVRPLIEHGGIDADARFDPPPAVKYGDPSCASISRGTYVRDGNVSAAVSGTSAAMLDTSCVADSGASAAARGSARSIVRISYAPRA